MRFIEGSKISVFRKHNCARLITLVKRMRQAENSSKSVWKAQAWARRLSKHKLPRCFALIYGYNRASRRLVVSITPNGATVNVSRSCCWRVSVLTPEVKDRGLQPFFRDVAYRMTLTLASWEMSAGQQDKHSTSIHIMYKILKSVGPLLDDGPKQGIPRSMCVLCIVSDQATCHNIQST